MTTRFARCALVSALAATAVMGSAVGAAVAEPAGGQWQAPVHLAPPDGSLQSVSCATASFCIAATYLGEYYVKTTAGWSAGQPIGAPGQVYAISCPSATMCVAGDSDGNVMVFDGSSWGAPTQITSFPIEGMSCPTVGFCMAIDRGGEAIAYVGGAWQTPVQVAPAKEPLDSVSCPSASFCGAFRTNWFYKFDGTNWSRPMKLGGNEVMGFSCASATMCVAVDDGAHARVYDGTKWGHPVRVERRSLGLSDVSCPSTRFCMAVDADSHAIRYRVGTGKWVDRTRIETPLSGFSLISCASAKSCVAINEIGDAIAYGR